MAFFFYFLQITAWKLKKKCGVFYAKTFLRKRGKGQVKRNENYSLHVIIKDHLWSLPRTVSVEWENEKTLQRLE